MTARKEHPAVAQGKSDKAIEACRDSPRRGNGKYHKQPREQLEQSIGDLQVKRCVFAPSQNRQKCKEEQPREKAQNICYLHLRCIKDEQQNSKYCQHQMKLIDALNGMRSLGSGPKRQDSCNAAEKQCPLRCCVHWKCSSKQQP